MLTNDVISFEQLGPDVYPYIFTIQHNSANFLHVSVSPYAVGAIVSASLAVVLIVIFILLAMKMRVGIS